VGLNPQPLSHESSALTTRPRLLALRMILKTKLLKLLFYLIFHKNLVKFRKQKLKKENRKILRKYSFEEIFHGKEIK
jgi:hypothetical protein